MDIGMEPHRIGILGLVMVDVKHERTAHGHVDELEAPANAEPRYVPARRGGDGSELQFVPFEVGFRGEMLRVRFAVTGRSEARAAGEAETHDVRRNGLTGLHDDHLGPRAFQRGDVVRAGRERARRGRLPDREGDPRASLHLGHGMESRRLARSTSSMSTPPDARGWRNATMPSAPRRGAWSTSSTPSRSRRTSAPARTSTT